ncbi:MAG: hypothetical protein NVSMB14_16210 [Isosphaeraceae bacterium]
MSDHKRRPRGIFQVENLEGRIALSGAAAHFAGSGHPAHGLVHFRPAFVSHGYPAHSNVAYHNAVSFAPQRFYGAGTPARFETPGRSETPERPGIESRASAALPSAGPDSGPNMQSEQRGNFNN